jgi:putative oxidoreductase
MLAFQRRLLDRGWALLPLRMIVGFGLAAHGVAKLNRGPEHFATVLATLGVPAPSVMAWVTSLAELIGGSSIMAGLLVIPWSLPMAIVMLTAMLRVHLPYGFSSIKLQAVTSTGAEFGRPGYELNVLYLAGLLTLVLGGSGVASLDRWIAMRRQDRKET